MLKHVAEQRLLTFDGVSQEMRQAAATRRGEWEVTTYDWVRRFDEWSGCTPMFKDTLVMTTVVYKEKEVARLAHLFRHGIRNETKMKTVYANLEQAAETFWSTGSLEHVAMRTLGVAALVRYLSGHRVRRRSETARRWFGECGAWMWGLAPGRKYYNTSLMRTTEDKREPETMEVGKVAEVEEAPTAIIHTEQVAECNAAEVTKAPTAIEVKATLVGDSSTLQRSDTWFVSGDAPFVVGLEEALGFTSKEPLGQHGGSTSEDADVIADADFRIISDGKIHKVVGQDFSGNDLDKKQVVGVVTAPIPCPPNVYNNSGDNLRAAKKERLDNKKVPYTGTKKDRAKMGKLIACAMSGCKRKGIFSTDRIQRWAEENMHLEEIKSGKWSQKRLEDSVNNLMTEAFPELQFKGSVKLEPMPEGKPPRMLIADGDNGQLMALIVVKCFEDLLFQWMEEHSIKHAAKADAIKRTVSSLFKRGARLVEGDGSAWDTTCNADIRDCVENPIIHHIMEVLIRYGVVPEQWLREHHAACTKKKLKLLFSRFGEKVRIQIEAIRRSGHRGTSCLNWWMNFANWVCAVFEEPERFLDHAVRNAVDVTGVKRWFNFCLEGDDSICSIMPPMVEGDPLNKHFIDWWTRQGFRMKVVYADKRATFCGYHIACVAGEPTGVVCPELPRAIKNAGISCSSQIVQAAKAGDVNKVRDIAAAGALARAADFAGILPTVSRKYHEYARSIKRSRDVADREMSIRAVGEDGHTFNEIEESIELKNSLVTPTDERETMEALGYHATWAQLDAFRLYPWDLETACDMTKFLDSLPPSWRPEA